MADAVAGFGTQLAYGSATLDSSPTYTTIGNLTGVKPGDFEGKTTETTDNESPGGWVERIPTGIRDAGKISADLNWNPDEVTHDNVTGFLATLGLKRAWKVTFPSGATFVSDGILTKFSPDDPYDDKMTGSIDIDLSGAPIWT